MTMASSALLSSLVSIVLLVIVGAALLARRRDSRQGAADLALAVAEGQHAPPSLHPIIDANLCIGSFSCIKACPEGDIIGVVDGVATLIEGAHCIGHSRCAIECPVGAIRLVFGTSERGVDLPETDERFESSRPGVYIVGELGGMGLIKNALRQGIEAGKAIGAQLKKSTANGDGVVDVVVVGGGPAGIASAVSLKEQGLTAHVFEQETLGGCVAHYPRGKVVMSEAVMVPFYGKFGRSLLSKEELLIELQGVLSKANVVIDEGQKVTTITGKPGEFVVATESGKQVKARAVVLAIGLRGSPRKLGVPGEDKSKVTYRLVDPEQFHGKRVLVVGGGDSAVEAAIQLAEESTAKVSISYRQDSFSRAKQRNRELIDALIAEERVRALLSTEVTAIEDKLVRLKTKDGVGELKNDVVIVSAGGEVPTAFLKAVGVSIRRYTGQEKQAPAAGPAGDASATPSAKPQRLPTKAEVEARTRRKLGIGLFALGGTILSALFLVGGEYYLLSTDDRREQLVHEMLRPAGLWGHSVGVIATVFMLATLLYPLRKRVRALKGRATIRSWLTFHMFVGVMSPLIVAFHAAFLMNNLLAVWTWAALSVVVGTGIFGRFLFGLVPAQAGKVLELAEVRARLKTLEKQLEPRLAEATNAEVVRGLFARVNATPAKKPLLRVLLDAPSTERRLRDDIARAQVYFENGSHFASFRDGLVEVARGRVQEAFYGSLKRFFRGWLVVHVVLSLFMLVLITAHVGVSLWLGFGAAGS